MTFFTLQAWSVPPCVRPISAVHMTAGHNALRGSESSWSQTFCFYLARILDARIEKIAERKQIVGLTINEIRVKDGWADLITRRKRKLSAARLRNAGLRLPRGPHVSSRGTRSQFDPPGVHSARAACRPFSTNSSVETGKSAGSAQPNRSQDSRGPPTSWSLGRSPPSQEPSRR